MPAALLLTLLLEQLGISSVQIQRLASSYSAFLNYAFDRKLCRFRNFMSYNRLWLEPAGSEDCQGRALWALGACVHRSKRRDLQFWASGFLISLCRLCSRQPRPVPGHLDCLAFATISNGSVERARPARFATP